jgi:3-deoxy-manno-octulosonate cytidylyltransferase (CMP-KDO synthetase)
MNVQGDEPDIDINDIKMLDDKMKSNNSKIGTLAAKIARPEMCEDENVVKVKIKESFNQNSFPQAENFMRKTKDKVNVFHHIGIYCYEVKTLKKFTSFNQSKNELENKLEQLRALDNNIDINVALANKSPIGVDTKEDYLAIKKIMKYK